ncbi:LuxR C-terminal-related transcriptional regulator [Arenimonas composti]|uniref:HTH luxR-type domain-containing protein n=1 Tax=Arenimonas composti TR7-09 = DSM 18010 TaxID=1121013 RepID=A0A091C0H2_9GAMM|nr:LuxR C-terminal-related transcriptional regulator [Arenimonas composti]KFN50130.1 hypothetical protein P873_08120 [Arenimonas composti TR7-09 = DSM 18010]
MSDAEFTLKSTPPRVPRAALLRERLVRVRDDVRESTAVFVVAPAGFGKSTLLLQWRRRWLEKGAQVAWLDADGEDEPLRFARAARFAVRAAIGRAGSGDDDGGGRAMHVLTGLLAEVARTGAETVLMIDQAERLPAATLHGPLQYLLLNAPGNLRIVLGSREPPALRTAELAAHGHAVVVGTDDLRLRPGEALEVLQRRLGSRLTLAEATRLQDLAEGWPLGLQLAVAAIEHEADLAAAVRRISARRGHLQSYFLESLPGWLAPPAYAFLVRAAILAHPTVELCRAVTGDPEAGLHLDALLRHSPILARNEDDDRYHLHPLARDFLLARFDELPAQERTSLHARAAAACEAAGLLHEAAQHALAAGDEAAATRLAIRALWSLGTHGRLDEATGWLARLPGETLAADATLALVAGWIHALGDGHAEALRHALAVAGDPRASPSQVMAALRVAGGAAIYADRIDLLPTLLARFPRANVPIDDPLFAVAPLNGQAFLALHAGDSARVRALVAQVLGFGSGGSLRLANAFATAMAALRHLADAEPRHAEALLKPALARAEREDGRRGTVAAILAAVRAATLGEAGDGDGVEAVLADRLDVVENAMPDLVLAAYRALIRAAAARGDERRALTLIASLEAVGQRRGLPRLRLHALTEQIRLHAHAGRAETATRLVATLDRFLAAIPPEPDAPLSAQAHLAAALARALAAYANADHAAATRELARADALATRWRRGRDALTILVLRALLGADGDREAAARLLAEARGLAAIGGVGRVFAEAHPAAVALARELLPAENGSGRNGARAAAWGAYAAYAATTSEAAEAAAGAAPTVARAPARAGLLTAKEAEILRLLGRGLSNKSIARALDVSAETIKWHLKNVFAKLGAGTRRHAVERARLLDLVD